MIIKRTQLNRGYLRKIAHIVIRSSYQEPNGAAVRTNNYQITNNYQKTT